MAQITGSSACTIADFPSLLDNKLLILLQLVNDVDGNINSSGSNVVWSESEPLGEGYISNPVGLIKLKIDKLFILGDVLNIMASVIWEDTSVAGGKIEGTG